MSLEDPDDYTLEQVRAAFIDYPDRPPRGPLSPEAAAIFETFKEIAARLDIKIVLSKPTPLAQPAPMPRSHYEAPR